MQCVSSCSGGLACMQSFPFHNRETVVSSQFAMEARSSLRALACSSPALANTWPFLLMHYDRPVLLTLAFSRSLVSFMSSYLVLSLDATALLGPGGPSPTTATRIASTLPSRTQPSLWRLSLRPWVGSRPNGEPRRHLQLSGQLPRGKMPTTRLSEHSSRSRRSQWKVSMWVVCCRSGCPEG